MKKKINLTFLLFVVIFGASCNNNSITPNGLLGNWEAISISVDGQPLEIDYPITRLLISEDGTYDYSGTLNYKESGRWHLQNNYFITKDTLLPDMFEKTMQISNLTPGSFEMKMTTGKKERVLVMIKSNSQI